MFRGLFEGWHLVILIIVVLVLFGGKRLPDAARGLGRSLRIFKAEVNQMQAEDRRTATPDPTPGAPTPPAPLEGTVVRDDPVNKGQTTDSTRDA